ncbi:serine protease [Agriterribacter sp.]|uniref:S1 family peptidase n=1 Tax=Agriterribacter sp. TaxID=2821509 RepID=UPI002BE4CFFF|nr:serine protease [Agriterribacter sp.]HRO47670.1 serine protease [Agriterribacter sp.]HRQ17651.1 serine protease [Agriterribacter sp.]
MRKILFVLLLFAQVAQGQGYFSTELIDCVVSLEKEDSLGKIIPHGTGFCIYNYNNPGELIVVTNEHVLRNGYIYIKSAVTDSAFRFMMRYKIDTVTVDGQAWVLDGYNLHTKVFLKYGVNYLPHESLDIAIFKVPSFSGINIGTDSVKVFKTTSLPLSLIKSKNDVKLGTPVYFVGFPFGIGHSYGFTIPDSYNDEKLTPLVRRGIVAWKSDTKKEFLLDAFSYPGNSGSPVYSETGVFGKKPGLIGIVYGHLGQPGKDGSNFGLARCYWVDEILELIKRL